MKQKATHNVKTRDFRDELILQTTVEWIKADPSGARAFAEEAKMNKAQQHTKTGGFRKGGDGDKAGMHVKYRIPQMLLDCIRLVFHHYQTEGHPLEPFALDDKDMKLLCREFPDLFGVGSNMRWKRGH